jgi:type IV pilus assembly protein PilV
MNRLAPGRNGRQKGFFLLEALVAILIFSLGILGMVAMGGAAIAGQSDAQFRTDAATLASEIAAEINMRVTRTNDPKTNAAAIQASLDVFQHHPATVGYCAFTGTPSTEPAVVAWLTKVTTVDSTVRALPGSAPELVQISIDNSAGIPGAITGFNRVKITLCWQAPSDKNLRRYELITYIN